ncbi:MAG: polyphosphate polymerase domain-containing protein [Bacteroidales bacterium]|nr:polyphosphate polymerase domain-containing protein [Bacteroidales bacterium]
MDGIADIVQGMKPITLDEMKSVQLMNRIDTKYVVTDTQLREILSRVCDSYYAQEVENNRFSPYRTLYYDTPELAMYIAHHNRHLAREKVRVRTYVDTDLTFCEIKHKNNKGRTRKERIKMERVDNIVENPNTAAFLAERQPYEVESLRPQLETAFNRVTLVNFEKTERLTIDCDLTFNDKMSGKVAKMAPLVVMELKQDGRAHSLLKDVFFDMRIKPFKISKYCIGICLTRPEVKQNRFKKKLMKIDKLKNLC